MALRGGEPYHLPMKFSVSAHGGKAPPSGLTQVVDGVDEAIRRYRQMDQLFDETAAITVADERGARLSLSDLYNLRGASDA
jgi:hypothetical protein